MSADQNNNWVADSYEKDKRSVHFHPADTLANLPRKKPMDKPVQNLPEGSPPQHHSNLEDDQTSSAGNSSSNSQPPVSPRKSAGKDPMYYSVGSTSANQSSRMNPGTSKSRTRSNSANRPKHLHPIEVQGKRVLSHAAEANNCDSPYACKIFEIPSAQDITAKKIIVSDRDHKYLQDQIDSQGLTIQKLQASTSTEAIVRWLSSQQSLEENSFVPHIAVGPMPLESWPTSKDLKITSKYTKHTVNETKTEAKAEDEAETKTGTKADNKSAAYQNKHNKPKPNKKTTPVSSQHQDKPWIGTPSSVGVQVNEKGEVKSLASYTDSFTQADDSLSHVESTDSRSSDLGALAQKLERSVFSAYEASSVIIQTVFKESLGDPRSLEAILESPEFQAFLHAPNEIEALKTLSTLFSQSSRNIADYLESLQSIGVSFPPKTEFSSKSNQALLAAAKSASNCKSVRVAAATAALNKRDMQNSYMYSFTPHPPSTPLGPLPTRSNYSLTLYRNPENGDIIQTIQCGNSIYRTTFSTSPLQCDRIRSLMSASTEHFGLPELPLPERLMDTFIRSSSFASSSLTVAKTSFLKCCRDMYRTSVSFQDSKYTMSSVKSRRSHTALVKRLRELNMYTGMIYQMSFDLFTACEAIQVGIRKSLEVQECLKFPRIPNYPNPRLNKDCQLPAAIGGAVGPSSSSSSSVPQIPMHSAMVRLSEGIKGLAHTTRMGYFCLESERAGGIQLTRTHRKNLKEFLSGLKALGNHKEVDFGCLLMGILCSSELIGKKFSPEDDKINKNVEGTVDSFHRAAIVSHLGKINWAMLEIVSSVKRMKNDAYILTLHTTKRLKEARLKRFYY